MYVPPKCELNRTYMKAILKGDKVLIPLNLVKFINIPKYDELSVRKIMDLIKGDLHVLKHLPDDYQKKRTISREWFFNVINSVHPEFLG